VAVALILVCAVFFSRLWAADETQIESSFCEGIRVAKKQKSVFAGEMRGSNLREILPPKSEQVRRAWVPTTSMVISCSSLPFGSPPHPRNASPFSVELPDSANRTLLPERSG
jgi:hypothetical protein